MDDYKECEDYPLLHSLDQKYFQIEKDQLFHLNDFTTKYNEKYSEEQFISLCSLFISQNQEENMHQQYETFEKIANIIKNSDATFDIEYVTNEDFGDSFCSLMNYIYREGTVFTDFIKSLKDICINNSQFIDCLSSTDLSSMLFDIFVNSNDEICNLIMDFLHICCFRSIHMCKTIFETWDMTMIIDYFNRIDDSYSLSILTSILRNIPESSDGIAAFCESIQMLKEPNFTNTRYYTCILINIIAKNSSSISQLIHLVETTIKHSDCNNKGEISLVLVRSAFRTHDDSIIFGIIQQIPFNDIFVDYVNCSEEICLCYYHWLFNIIYLFLLEKTAPHEYASRFSSHIDPSEVHETDLEDKDLNILSLNEFFQFFFDDDVCNKIFAAYSEGCYDLRYSALSLIHVLLYTNNSEFYNLIIAHQFPRDVSAFLEEIDSDPSNDKDISIQTKVLQIYVLLLRKTPLNLRNNLVTQIYSSDAIPILENIGYDDSEYIIRLLRSYSI